MYQYSTNSYITADEVMAIIKAVPEISKFPERDQLLISVVWETGGRVSEVLALVPEHVLDKSIVLDNLKQKRKRKDGKPPQKIITVSPFLSSWIRNYCTKNNIERGQWVFHSEHNTGKRLNRAVAHKMITAASEKAGVFRLGKANMRTGGRYKGISFHVLRHSIATHLLHKGATIKVVQAHLGHSLLASTNMYTNIGIDDVRSAVEAADVHLYHPQE